MDETWELEIYIKDGRSIRMKQTGTKKSVKSYAIQVGKEGVLKSLTVDVEAYAYYPSHQISQINIRKLEEDNEV